jgi:hypothetical protein
VRGRPGELARSTLQTLDCDADDAGHFQSFGSGRP